MFHRLVPLTAAVVLGCQSNPHDGSRTSLVMKLSAETITVAPGEKLFLEIIVIGAGSDPVAISSPDLPGFATLSDTTLILSPGRTDIGNHVVTLVARSGSQSVSDQVSIAVDRANTAPTLRMRMNLDGSEIWSEALAYQPKFYIEACDGESDPMTAEVEVVPAGKDFTGEPTFRRALTDCSGSCCNGEVAITLPSGAWYKDRERVRDDLGASSDWEPNAFPWMLGPCANGPCPGFGLPWDKCLTASDCVSSACVPWSGTTVPAGWHPDMVCASCPGGPCPGGGLPLDNCTSGEDCVTGQCDLHGQGIPGLCVGAAGAPCSSRHCLSQPLSPVCRVGSQGQALCTAN
jgi:hypothetical protein